MFLNLASDDTSVRAHDASTNSILLSWLLVDIRNFRRIKSITRKDHLRTPENDNKLHPRAQNTSGLRIAPTAHHQSSPRAFPSTSPSPLIAAGQRPGLLLPSTWSLSSPSNSLVVIRQH
jgi:hypothetical protein